MDLGESYIESYVYDINWAGWNPETNTHLPISTQKIWILICQKHYLLAQYMLHVLKCSQVCQHTLLKPSECSYLLFLFYPISFSLSLSPTHTHTHTHTHTSQLILPVSVCDVFTFVHLNSQGNWGPVVHVWASLVAQMVKNPPAMQETHCQLLLFCGEKKKSLNRQVSYQDFIFS